MTHMALWLHRELRTAEDATEMAAPVLDGPHSAPSPRTEGSLRVRMEAWQVSVDLGSLAKPWRTPRRPPEATQPGGSQRQPGRFDDQRAYTGRPRGPPMGRHVGP